MNARGRPAGMFYQKAPDPAPAHAAARPPAPVKNWRGRVARWFQGDHTLHNSEIIFSAVTRLANSLSAMPIQLYHGTEAVENGLNDLLRYAPNPNMTSCNFFKTLEAARDTSGNSYALKTLDSDWAVTRLDVLDSTRVRPVLTEDTKELWYRILTEDGREIYLHNFYLLHFQFASASGFSGVNPVSVLFNTLGYADNIKHFSVEQLEKGINAAVVLEAPAQLGDQQKTDMVKSFLSVYRETGGNILLLESGVTAKALNLSPVDSKLFEVEKVTRSKVATVYNIPPHMLGDYSDSSFSTMEQQMLEFLTLTMLPIVTLYEQELNRKLLTREQRREGYRWKFDMENLLRADAATKADVNTKAVRSAWKTPNEVRAENGYPMDPDGYGLMASRDLLPLNIAVRRPELLLGRKMTAGVASGETVAQTQPAPSDEISKISLNGAQISSILEITQAVATRAMTRDAALTLLTEAFPFSMAVAERILGEPKLPKQEGGAE